MKERNELVKVLKKYFYSTWEGLDISNNYVSNAFLVWSDFNHMKVNIFKVEFFIDDNKEEFSLSFYKICDCGYHKNWSRVFYVVNKTQKEVIENFEEYLKSNCS